MRKTINFLTKAVYVMAGIILLFLAYNSMHYTFMPFLFDDSGVVFEAPDSRLRNLIFVLAVFVGCVIFSKLLFIGTKNKHRKASRVKGFLVLDLIAVGIFLFLYVKNTHIAPYWDQAQVLLDASAFLKGDFSSMAGNYLHKFPQQLGLIFWEIPFLFIWNDFAVFQYLNIVFVLLTIYLSYRLCKELFSDEFINFLAIVFTTLFLPMYVYTNFVYGDLPSIMGCLFIGFMITRWVKIGKSKYLIMAVLAACIFTMVRENVLIFLIASSISIALISIKNRRYISIVFAALIIIIPLLACEGANRLFEYKSGQVIDNPIPSIGWMAMGLQGEVEEGAGVGYYNGYNEAVWWYEGATTEGAKAAFVDYSKERLSQMFSDPAYMYKFFRFKILEQWIEPSFDSIYMTKTNSEEAGPWAVTFYSGDYPLKLIDFMNRMMTITYFFGFIYMIYAFKHEVTPGKIVLIVAFIGGFLFSIIWEAKGRYTMPYYVFMLPIAAAGLGQLVNAVNLLINKFIFKRKVDK